MGSDRRKEFCASDRILRSRSSCNSNKPLLRDLDDDVAVEVLSRLPAKSLLEFKCISRSWNNFISNPSFILAHSQRSKEILGLFVHVLSLKHGMDSEASRYMTLDKKPYEVLDTVLDFLPEEVVVTSSCNGILCCSNVMDKHALNQVQGIHQKTAVIYICNPATKQWVALRPRYDVGEALGLVVYPHDSSPASTPSFKLVGIKRCGNNVNSCSFIIYSSDTETWKISREICYLDPVVCSYKHIFVNGRLHWLALDYHLLTFDVDQEWSQVIELPDMKLHTCSRLLGCLGATQGYLHYVCVYKCELNVWTLKDYTTPKWELKFRLPTLEFYKECVRDHGVDWAYLRSVHAKKWTSIMLIPLAFHNDSVFLEAGGSIYSYDFRTGEGVMLMDLIDLDLGKMSLLREDFRMLPYCPSITSLRNLKGSSVKEANLVGEVLIAEPTNARNS